MLLSQNECTREARLRHDWSLVFFGRHYGSGVQQNDGGSHGHVLGSLIVHLRCVPWRTWSAAGG